MDDISFLVNETLKHAEAMSFDKNSLQFDFAQADTEALIEEVSPLVMPDEGPGLFFHLQKKASTFVIRIQPSSDMAADYKTILEFPENYPSLRLLEDDGNTNIESKLSFFECDSYEMANLIKSQLSNKRFPIFEENVFNLSDPGDSWWVKDSGDEISIFFKLSRTEQIDDLVKLGPLGDCSTNLEAFNKLYGYFKMLFPLGAYSSAHGKFTISTTDSSNFMFKEFKNLLLEGESNFDFWHNLRELERESSEKPYINSLRQANYFLMELSNMRRFWRVIEQKLEA